MNAKGKTLLRVCGVCEVLLGAATLGLILYSLSLDAARTQELFGTNPTGATFLQLAGAYLLAGFEILTGVIGIALADKPKSYKVCMFFGIILLVIVAFQYVNMKFTVANVVPQIIATIVPVLYFVGALQNKETA